MFKHLTLASFLKHEMEQPYECKKSFFKKMPILIHTKIHDKTEPAILNIKVQYEFHKEVTDLSI